MKAFGSGLLKMKLHIYTSQFPIYWNGVLSYVNLFSTKMLNPMNIEIKYIRKYSFLHLMLIYFSSSLQNLINRLISYKRLCQKNPFLGKLSPERGPKIFLQSRAI